MTVCPAWSQDFLQSEQRGIWSSKQKRLNSSLCIMHTFWGAHQFVSSTVAGLMASFIFPRSPVDLFINESSFTTWKKIALSFTSSSNDWLGHVWEDGVVGCWQSVKAIKRTVSPVEQLEVVILSPGSLRKKTAEMWTPPREVIMHSYLVKLECLWLRPLFVFFLRRCG